MGERLGRALAVLTVVLVAGSTTDAAAFEHYISRVPSCAQDLRCPTCHNNASGGTGCSSPPCLNDFGLAFRAAGYSWTAALQSADSDGDGYTNTTELMLGDCSLPGLASSQPNECRRAYDDCLESAACVDLASPPGFSCTCPSTQYGDGRARGTGCLPKAETCGTAQWIGYQGSRLRAELSTTDGPATCGPMAADRWFRWSAQCTGTARFTWRGTGTVTLAAYESNPSTCFGRELGCAARGTGGNLSVDVVRDRVYMLRVGDGGDGFIEPSCEGTDSCEAPQRIYDGEWAEFDTASARTGSPQPSTCGDFGEDLWFALPNYCQGAVTVDTAGSEVPLRLGIYEGCETSARLLDCRVGALAAPARSTAQGLIRIGAAGADGRGRIRITCSNPRTCTGAVPIQDGALRYRFGESGYPYRAPTPGCPLDGSYYFTHQASCTGTVTASVSEIDYPGCATWTIAAVDGRDCNELGAPRACATGRNGVPGTPPNVPPPCTPDPPRVIRFPTIAGDPHTLVVLGAPASRATLTLRCDPAGPGFCAGAAHLCEAPARCDESGAAPRCACPPGFTGDGRPAIFGGSGCTEIDECAASPCGPAGVDCRQLEPPRYTCQCAAGYAFDGTTCVDVDECATVSLCDSSAECVNLPGSSECRCGAGFEGDGYTCIDIDECARGIHGCDANAACSNQLGSHRCECGAGWEGSGLVCADIEECARGLHECGPSEVCVERVGAPAECACRSGTSRAETGACAVICGDGVRGPGERCDDGNASAGDGCDATCAIERGWSCYEPEYARSVCAATCGDGIVDVGEECDDGDANSDTAPDACRTWCRSASCGDGVEDDGEVCDEGDANDDIRADACRTTCQPASCGDGVRDAPEACDPGGGPGANCERCGAPDAGIGGETSGGCATTAGRRAPLPWLALLAVLGWIARRRSGRPYVRHTGN